MDDGLWGLRSDPALRFELTSYRDQYMPDYQNLENTELITNFFKHRYKQGHPLTEEQLRLIGGM